MKTRPRLLAVACGLALLGVAHAVGVPGQGTWETTLLPRELDGNALNGPEAFYDTALDITWLRNADVNVLVGWDAAMTWANTLVVGGVGGWRLPKVVDTGAPGCDYSFVGTDCGYNVQTATSEVAHLWYVTLGNKALYDTSGTSPQPGWGLTNTGAFQNLRPVPYWSGTEYAPNPLGAWAFNANIGSQNYVHKSGPLYAIAVRPGDVPVVPEPETYAMMLVGLGVVSLLTRKRRSRNAAT